MNLGSDVKKRNKCPNDKCNGEMIWVSNAGWLAGKRLICSNPFCPGKKLVKTEKEGPVVEVVGQ